MRDTFREIRSRMDELEQQLRQELAAKQEEFRYTVEKKKVRFSREVQEAHRALLIRWTAYAYESGVFKVLTIPIIWFALTPGDVSGCVRHAVSADLLSGLRHPHWSGAATTSSSTGTSSSI